MIDLAQKIKEIRNDKRLTQKELAEKLGVTVNGYQKIESSEDIGFSRLQQIAEIFEMSVVEIINYPNGADDTERTKALEKQLMEARKAISVLVQITDNLDLIKKTLDLASQNQIVLDEYYQTVLQQKMELAKKELEPIGFQNVENLYLWKTKLTLSELVAYQISLVLEALRIKS